MPARGLRLASVEGGERMAGVYGRRQAKRTGGRAVSYSGRSRAADKRRSSFSGGPRVDFPDRNSRHRYCNLVASVCGLEGDAPAVEHLLHPMSLRRRSPATRPGRSRATCAVLVIALLAGCKSYGERTRGAYDDFRAGRFEPAIEAYSKKSLTGSSFLAGAEAGMVALAAGDWDAALRQLASAAEAVAEYERQALVSPEGAARSIASFALNESVLEYRGEGYERVQLHTGLALAYFAKGLLEDARVEVRRANALLESEEELYEKEYAAGGLGHFLSAVSYELALEPDQAYIDYERMHEKGLGGELVTRSLARLARALGRDEETRRWEEQYGRPESLPDGAACVILIAGVGMGPFKVEGTLPIPTPEGLLQWSVPSYQRNPQPIAALVLAAPRDELSARSVLVENVSDVAKKNLDDRLLWLVTKSTARAFLKREATRALEDEHGTAGRIAGDLFTFFSERADLRAWQTLPDTWQAARLYVEAGDHRLRLEAPGGESIDLGTFALDPGETMFVFARTIGQRVYAHPVGGVRVDPDAPPAGPPNPVP